MTHPNKIRVLEPFIGMVLFIVLAIYVVNAFNTGGFAATR